MYPDRSSASADTNPWTTHEFRVFAEGQRVDEIPIAVPKDGDVIVGKEIDGFTATLLIPMLRPQRRRMFRRLPFCAVPGYGPISLDSNDPFTVACGFRQRVLRKVPDADPVLLKEFAEFCALEAAKLPCKNPTTLEEWLAETSYNEHRKDELREADLANRGGSPPRSVAQRVAAFVKTEFYCALKHCRLICSRCDRFKVFSGPAAKVIESVIYEMPEFIKHTPVPERPAKVASLRKAGRHYYMSDFTAFESHFIAKIMVACELQFYKHILRDWVYCDFMCSVLSGINKLSSRLGFRASCLARRMTGEMFTSVGNGITNLMLAKFLCHKQGKELYGFVEGDDGLFATEAVLTEQMYAKLGFTIKLVEIEDPCTCYPITKNVEPGSMAFCGLIFSETGDIIKDFRKFFQGFGWTSSFITAGDSIMMQLLRSKALSAIFETPQCPIIGVMARYALMKTRGVAISKTVRDHLADGYHTIPKDEMSVPPFKPSPETRALYARIFGISENVQILVEKAIEAGDFALVSEILPAPDSSARYCSRYVVVT